VIKARAAKNRAFLSSDASDCPALCGFVLLVPSVATLLVDAKDVVRVIDRSITWPDGRDTSVWRAISKAGISPTNVKAKATRYPFATISPRFLFKEQAMKKGNFNIVDPVEQILLPGSYQA
jgi:hypothetical protein